MTVAAMCDGYDAKDVRSKLQSVLDEQRDQKRLVASLSNPASRRVQTGGTCASVPARSGAGRG